MKLTEICPSCGGDGKDNPAVGDCPLCLRATQATAILAQPGTIFMPRTEGPGLPTVENPTVAFIEGATGLDTVDDPYATRAGPSDSRFLGDSPTDPDATAAPGLTTEVASGTGTRSRSSPGPSVPGYEIIRVLGRGGMGVVYQARQIRANRMVALKMVIGEAHLRPDHLERFRVEAESVAGLRHPNIVQVYDVGEVDGLPYFSLEFLEGGTLGDRLSGTPMPSRQAAELLATLAGAIHGAHLAGIAHRDLKPVNILFDIEGIPKIVDFGLAKRLEVEDGQTMTGQIMGTPSYMAPEQARGENRQVGPPADIYALGAVLYEMITGRPPFRGPSISETIRMVVFEDPVSPAKLQPKLDHDLGIICLKCLAKEPAKRYSSAGDLADDLGRYLAGEPIRARPTPRWERAVKWARRHPTSTSLLATAAAVLLAAGGIVARYEAGKRDQERSEETRVVGVRAEADLLVFDGQGLIAQERWSEARQVLSNVLTRLRDERRLADVRARAASLLGLANQGSDRQNARDVARGRFQEFLRLRNETLFHDTHFTGLDLSGNVEATRKSALAALALFDPPGAGDDGPSDHRLSGLSEEERATIRDGSYVMLLILAESESRPEDGLKDLDRATRLIPGPTRAYHLRRAACLARAGDRESANREVRAAEGLAPSTAFDQFLAGQERYKGGDWSGSLRHLEAALRLEPDNFWAHALSAICLLQMKRPSEAKLELQACLQRERSFAWLYILRGFASSQIASQSHDPIDRNRSQVGGSLPIRADGPFEAAAADYNKALEMLRGRPGDELNYVVRVNRGLLAFQRGDLVAAEADLREAVRLNDRNFQAFAGLAQVSQRQGRLDEGIEQFGRAISLRPDWAPLYRGRADLIIKDKDATPEHRQAARGDLERAITLEPPGSPVIARDRINLARLLHREGRDPEALAASEAALKVLSDYPEGHLLRIEILLSLRRYDDVIGSCDVALALGRPSSELFELRGLARAGLRNFAGAIEDNTQALAIHPGHPPLLIRRGWDFLMSNAPELALRDFEEAVRLDPSSAEAYTGRGSALIRLGKHRQAVADAEEGLRRSGPSARASYNAARIYALASAKAAADIPRDGREGVQSASRYQARAVTLLRNSLEQTPPQRRSAFWRDQVLSDPALRPIRLLLKSSGLPSSLATMTEPPG